MILNTIVLDADADEVGDPVTNALNADDAAVSSAMGSQFLTWQERPDSPVNIEESAQVENGNMYFSFQNWS